MKVLIIYKAICLLVQSYVVKAGYFWQVTDFHYDANYSTDGNPKHMCHQSNPSNYNNSVYGNYLCDSPMKLIVSAITAMKTIQPNPDFILWTGDSVPHVQNSELDQMKVYYNIGNVTEQLLKIFPNTTIYPVLGNHDEYPKDAFPPGNTTYYNDILAISQWSHLLGNDEAEQFKTGGYYKTVVNSKLLIIGLNTNVYYGMDSLTINSSDPVGQFDWLEKQLQQAASNKQKVIIIAHVPPGLFELASGLMWFRNVYNERYVNIVTRYSKIIEAQIYGHEHTDSFRVLTDKNGNPSGMLFLSPSVTPWKSTLPGVGPNNPSVRLYEYDQLTGQILDYSQYFLNLSSVIITNVPKWEKEYDAKHDYELAELNPRELMNAARSLTSHPDLLQKYLRFNSVSQNLNPVCDDTCQKVHICTIENLRTSNFKDCLKKPYSSPEPRPNTHPQYSTTKGPEKPVPHYMIIVICTVAGVVFLLAVIVAIVCIKRNKFLAPHRYSRFSSPLGKGPIN